MHCTLYSAIANAHNTKMQMSQSWNRQA